MEVFMSHELSKRKQHTFWPFSSFWEDEGWFPNLTNVNFPGIRDQSGLSLSEDDQHVIIEAALPGLSTDEIDVRFDQGSLWIKGQKQEKDEDKKRHYYRKSSRSYSYHVHVPGNIDDQAEPHAHFQNGMMTIKFKKNKQHEAKKIKVLSS